METEAGCKWCVSGKRRPDSQYCTDDCNRAEIEFEDMYEIIDDMSKDDLAEMLRDLSVQLYTERRKNSAREHKA
jgi:hypothetical protein